MGIQFLKVRRCVIMQLFMIKYQPFIYKSLNLSTLCILNKYSVDIVFAIINARFCNSVIGAQYFPHDSTQ